MNKHPDFYLNEYATLFTSTFDPFSLHELTFSHLDKLTSDLSQSLRATSWKGYVLTNFGHMVLRCPILHSGNIVLEPSVVCFWKLVMTTQLEKGSNSSTLVHVTAPKLPVHSREPVCWSVGWQRLSTLVPLQPLPSRPSLFSSHHPCPTPVCYLRIHPQLPIHTLICHPALFASGELQGELDLFIALTAFCSASFCALLVSSARSMCAFYIIYLVFHIVIK